MRAWLFALIAAAPAHADSVSDHCKNPPTIERGGIGEPGCEAASHPPEPLPTGVVMTIAPKSLAVKSGDVLDVQLVLTNTTDRDVELFLDEGDLGFVPPTYEIDAGTKRVDVVDQPCGKLVTLEHTRSVHIMLGPHHHSASRLLVRATATSACGNDAGPIKRGSYTLVVTTPAGNVKAPLTVR